MRSLCEYPKINPNPTMPKGTSMASMNLPTIALDERTRGIFIESDGEGGAVIWPLLPDHALGLPLPVVAPEIEGEEVTQNTLLAAPRWRALLSAIAAAAGGAIMVETATGTSWVHRASTAPAGNR